MRENELACLNKIKDNYIKHTGIKKDFDNSDYLIMESILTSAHQNEKHSDFPDFFFDGGIIEHFEVTASDETRKGSQYKVDDAYCQREKEKHFKQLDKEFMESPHHPGTMTTQSVEDTHECFSYEAFKKSFKRNTNKHLVSLRKSLYNGKIVVFLIEQQGARLCIYANNRFYKFYTLSEDKNLLVYIKENMSDVNYIIFTASDSYEILDLSKIDSMISRAKDNQDIRGGTQRNISLKLYIDM